MLADISAGSVLASDCAVKWPQEQLDQLCSLAGQVLSFGAQERALALLAGPLGCHVFLRLGEGSGEVLCSVFAAAPELDQLVELADLIRASLGERTGPT